MKTRKRIRAAFAVTAALGLAVLFYSCKKTVTLKLNNAAAEIVIQGEVTDAPGPYTVTINQTVGFYKDNTYPPISGAVVKISDGQGETDSLTETATPGTYATHILQGRSGNTYTLSVFAQNKQYTAVSTMPALVPLDSVTFETTSGFGQHQTNAVVNFQDPPGIKNYYQFMEYINGQLFNKEFFIFEDRLSDGRYISNTLYMDSTYLQSGQDLEVKMYCIDENVYNYFFQLNQSGGGGGFNTASPANPVSNISNGALGYFSAHTTQSISVGVPNQ
ncbi:MAG: DUF4249 domain-containing protein [Puia sp.]|nr:DUF4249 domain-containing protein [Puia sp.]